jgi:hypothetical protein
MKICASHGHVNMHNQHAFSRRQIYYFRGVDSRELDRRSAYKIILTIMVSDGSVDYILSHLNSVHTLTRKFLMIHGPYKVVTRINDVVYRIQRNPRSRMMVVHLDRLAPYQGAARDEQT